jgi:GTP-binding protein
VSSINGSGMKILLTTSIKVWKQLTTRIETPHLNRVVQKWTDTHSIKLKGKPLKIRYATQVSVNPVKFVFFVNRRRGLRNEYMLYIKNRLRKEFCLDLIPLDIAFRVKEVKERNL